LFAGIVRREREKANDVMERIEGTEHCRDGCRRSKRSLHTWAAVIASNVYSSIQVLT
jgi:hypothetical protein